MIKINKFFIPYVFFLTFIGFEYNFIVSFLWILIHEISHIAVARALGMKDAKLYFMPMGTYVESKFFDETEPNEDIMISLAGPCVNLVLSGIFYIIYKYMPYKFVEVSLNTNLVLGVINLIPAFPLDGSRIIRAVLSKRMMYKRASKIAVKISFIMGGFMLAIFIFLIFTNRFNISIGLIAVLILIISYQENKKVVYIIMGDIIRKYKRFLKNKYIENKSVSIYYKSDLITLLGLVDKNKYNIFLVLNDDMKVISEITEYEVIEGLKIYGNITIENYLSIRNKSMNPKYTI